MSSSEFSREVVDEVFRELLQLLDPKPAQGRAEARAECVCAVGGYRRGKRSMKDLELLYIPRTAKVPDPMDMLGNEIETDVTERLWNELVELRVLAPRKKVNGTISAWGPWNKHAVHLATGLPLDLFAATAENYANRLVVTTGPRELNVAIASAAHKLKPALEWEVAEAGFVPFGKKWENTPEKQRVYVRSEADVFRVVNLAFLPPNQRR